MKCYLINLDRSPDRLERMTSLLSAAGVVFLRQPAVDGAAMSNEDRDKVFVPTPKRTPLSAGEIACFLSHRLCWEKIAAGADFYGCVLEDDLHVSEAMGRFTDGDAWISAGADLVKLETWDSRVWLDRASVDAGRGFALHRLRGLHWGGGAYVMSKALAARLLEETRQFSEPVDDMLFNPACGLSPHLTIYQMSPALCVQHQYFHGPEGEGDFLSSTLHGQRSLAHVIRPNSSLKRLIVKVSDKLRRLAAGQMRVRVPFDKPKA